MAYEYIIFDVTEGVATLTLNRPDAANGMHLPMVQEIHHAVTRCDQDASIRCLLITGAGKMFSAGGDLKFFQDAGDDIGATLTQMTTFFHSAVSIMNRMAAPVVMAINGTAAGGGLSFALSGDLLFAAQSAKFTLAYTAAGLSPDGSSSHFLPRLLGLRRAKELLLTNRLLSAEEALGYNMIDRVVADDALLAEAQAQAQRFAQGPTQAYGAVKALLAESFSDSLETQMEKEARTINRLIQGADGREGVAAFAAKRKANFTGRT